MNPSQIKELMGVSNQIAELNFNRFSLGVFLSMKKMLVHVVGCFWCSYKGLDFANLTNSVQEYSQMFWEI